MLKWILTLGLVVVLYNTTVAQNYLVTRNVINQKIQEGYFMQRLNTTITDDNRCITAAEAKSSLFLNETTLPSNGRVPWWIELVPLKTIPCTGGKTLCEVSNAEYSACGAYIYNQGFNNTLTTFTRTKLTNAMWSGVTANCTAVPPTTAGVALIGRMAFVTDSAIVYKGADSSALLTGKNLKIQAMAAATVYPGPLNSCAVWACDNTNTLKQWQYIERTINVPVRKTYYMGIAADNAFRFSINGWMVITFGTESQVDAFRIWHIFPIELGPGLQTLRFEAYNLGDVAALGVEFYDNTAAEIISATSRSNLKVMFTTAGVNNAVMCN